MLHFNPTYFFSIILVMIGITHGVSGQQYSADPDLDSAWTLYFQGNMEAAKEALEASRDRDSSDGILLALRISTPSNDFIEIEHLARKLLRFPLIEPDVRVLALTRLRSVFQNGGAIDSLIAYSPEIDRLFFELGRYESAAIQNHLVANELLIVGAIQQAVTYQKRALELYTKDRVERYRLDPGIRFEEGNLEQFIGEALPFLFAAASSDSVVHWTDTTETVFAEGTADSLKVSFYSYRGVALINSGKREAGLELLEKGRRVSPPHDYSAQLLQAGLLSASGFVEEALEILPTAPLLGDSKECVREFPYGSSLANILLLQSDFEGAFRAAKDELSSAQKCVPISGVRVVKAELVLGTALFRKGELELGKQHLLRAFHLSAPPSLQAFRIVSASHLATIYGEIGRADSSQFYSEIVMGENHWGREIQLAQIITRLEEGSNLPIQEINALIEQAESIFSAAERTNRTYVRFATAAVIAHSRANYSGSVKQFYLDFLSTYTTESAWVDNPERAATATATVVLEVAAENRTFDDVLRLARAATYFLKNGEDARSITLLTLVAIGFSANGLPEQAESVFVLADSLVSGFDFNEMETSTRIALFEQLGSLYTAWSMLIATESDRLNDPSGRARAHLILEKGRAIALLKMKRGAIQAVFKELESLETRSLVPDEYDAVMSYFYYNNLLTYWLIDKNGAVQSFDQRFSRDIGHYVNQTIARTYASNSLSDIVANRGVEGVRAISEANWSAAIDSLSGLLLPIQIQQSIPKGSNILIVPYGSLHYFPFSTLKDSTGSYFFEDRAYAITPSLSMVLSSERKQKSDRKAVVLADPVMPFVTIDSGERIQLPELPGTELEGKRVSSMLKAPLFSDSSATAESFIQALQTTDLVHVATHGYSYSEAGKALDSYLAFSPTSDSDGLFTANDLLRKEIRAVSDLVVLSACQTGLGNALSNEGVVGLQWALLAAGVKNVLASSWSVDDNATQILMELFYENYLNQQEPRSANWAISDAQKEMRSLGFTNPSNWGAFQVISAGSSSW